MSKDLADYYVNEFRNDIAKINFNEGLLSSTIGLVCFDKDAWLEAVKSMENETTKAYFIFSMFITVASDQTMFEYYHDQYKRFDSLTKYPKFGSCGLGPHNENPLYLIIYPIENKIIDSKLISDHLQDASQLFIDEINKFFCDYLDNINSKEFVEHFITDKYVTKIKKENNLIEKFISSIENNLNTH
jgi:hypothetical protein